MTPNELIIRVSAIFLGAFIGLFYFWGLWRTLLIIKRMNRPKLLLLSSYGIRTIIALLAFWFILRRDRIAFFFAFGGFIIMRFILTRKLGGIEGREKHAD
jgi:F1F0 ATPase subunit 2